MRHPRDGFLTDTLPMIVQPARELLIVSTMSVLYSMANGTNTCEEKELCPSDREKASKASMILSQ